MGVEVVWRWYPLSCALTGPSRTNSGFLEASYPVPIYSALSSSSKGSLYPCNSISRVRRSGNHDAPVNFVSRGMGGHFDLGRRSFRAYCRKHARASSARRLAASRAGKQNSGPTAHLYDNFSGRDQGQKPEEEVFVNSSVSMAQSDGESLVEEIAKQDCTVDSGTSVSFTGALDPPDLGDRTFRLMRRRLASATGPPNEMGSISAIWGKKEKIREVAECISHQASGVKIPSSLRGLKRKARARMVEGCRDVVAAIGDTPAACCGMKGAFASMFVMIRALQSYAVYMRETLHAEGHSQEIMYLLSKETHTSFVWLFQQVCCTPKLMVTLMFLLANFTVFCMGSNVANAATLQESSEPLKPTLLHPKVEFAGTGATIALDHGTSPQIQAFSVQYPYSGPSWRNCAASNLTWSHHPPSVTASGWGDDRSLKVGASHDGSVGPLDPRTACDQGELHNSASSRQFVCSLQNEQIHLLAAGEWKLNEGGTAKNGGSIATSLVANFPVARPQSNSNKSEPSLRQLLEETVKELELKSGEPYHHVYLDQETIRRLVAPVTVKVEPDDYFCFDRTELEYQHAISSEPSNPLLLANYAQFLYVVRRKHDSADALFRRAMKADPADGEVIGRYASFLWLARGDCALAEKAYKAAIAVDPSNPFFAGSYAHFLWHSEGDSACLINPMT